MANKQDITAGKAFVELAVRDAKFKAGLQAASRRMQAFGASVTQVGALLAGTGGVIAAPLLAATKVFANVGDSLNKMALRTGVSTEALSELGFAAEQSGSNLAAVEKGIRRMQRTIVDAAEGTSTGVDALKRLGLVVGDLQGLNPEEQFARISQQLSLLEDPTLRAAAAMDVFGRGATELLPLIAGGAAGIAALRAEAQRLGVTMTAQDAQAAADLTDALNRVVVAAKVLTIRIGGSLAPILTKASQIFTGLAVASSKFVKANPGLIIAIGAGAASLIGLGTAAIIAGVAITALGVIAGSVGTIVSILSAPITAIIAGVVVLGLAIATATLAVLYFTGSAKAMIRALGPAFENLKTTFMSAFNGITDALMSGDLELAGQIAMKGLQAAFFEGMKGVVDAFKAGIDQIMKVILDHPVIAHVLGVNASAGALKIGSTALGAASTALGDQGRLARAQLRSLELDAKIGNRGGASGGGAGAGLRGLLGGGGGGSGFGTFSAAAARAIGGTNPIDQFRRQVSLLELQLAQGEQMIRELRNIAPQFE